MIDRNETCQCSCVCCVEHHKVFKLYESRLDKALVRDGKWLDEHWCCKLCDGEIPDGHTDNCALWLLEKQHKDFIAKEYSAALTERDSALSRLQALTEAVTHYLDNVSTDDGAAYEDVVRLRKLTAVEKGVQNGLKPHEAEYLASQQMCRHCGSPVPCACWPSG
jgi:hypothetical protein